MKKITLGFSILAVSALLTVACNKKDNVSPEPDKELQSSLDVSYAGMVITDIEQICAFAGENDHYPKFYMPAVGATGTVVVTRDTVAKYLIITFNNTLCKDGRVRDGSIFMNYAPSDINANYYRDFKFQGQVSLTNYQVDGWKIKLLNSFIITNKVSPVDYKPQTTNLSWSMNGDFTMTHPTDSTKNIHANVDLVKTLLNTSTPTVFPVSKQAAINWSLAVVDYKGTMFGETSRKVPFVYKTVDGQNLVRDFQCTPDKVVGVTVGSSTVIANNEEFHPFVNGAASFTTSTLYPRVIHYGPEVPVDAKAAPCDNTGAVTIKGISYPVTFVKTYK